MHTDLWSFAITVYARPGVQQECLALQEAGGNVCLILCGLWLEIRGVEPVRERITALQAIAEPWHAQVIAPLRTLRQAWRMQAGADTDLSVLREQVKALELAAERTLLQRLQHSAAPWPTGAQGQWLEGLVPQLAGCDHDTLPRLRAAAKVA